MAGDPRQLAAPAAIAALLLPCDVPAFRHQSALLRAYRRAFAADDRSEPRLLGRCARAWLPAGTIAFCGEERSCELAAIRRDCALDRNDLCRAPTPALDPAGQCSALRVLGRR